MVAVTKTLQDAAYVAVGLGVIGFQRAQVRRQELRKQLDETRKDVASQVEAYRKQLEGTGKDLATQVEAYRSKLGELAERFEPVVKGAVRQVRPTA
jgi:hypothetical protein